jgi:hypothetical protein
MRAECVAAWQWIGIDPPDWLAAVAGEGCCALTWLLSLPASRTRKTIAMAIKCLRITTSTMLKILTEEQESKYPKLAAKVDSISASNS